MFVGRFPIPNQHASNVRKEILYTVTPIVVVAVLFGVSVATEQRLTRTTSSPPMVVNVTGFQWGWQFEYPDQHVTVLGTGEQQTPELVLPVDQTVQLVLRTNDVILQPWESVWIRTSAPGTLIIPATPAQ